MNASDAIQQIDDRTAKVVVVGQGYVGLPVAMRAVEVGFTRGRVRRVGRPGEVVAGRRELRRRHLRRRAHPGARTRATGRPPTRPTSPGSTSP